MTCYAGACSIVLSLECFLSRVSLRVVRCICCRQMSETKRLCELAELLMAWSCIALIVTWGWFFRVSHKRISGLTSRRALLKQHGILSPWCALAVTEPCGHEARTVALHLSSRLLRVQLAPKAPVGRSCSYFSLSPDASPPAPALRIPQTRLYKVRGEAGGTGDGAGLKDLPDLPQALAVQGLTLGEAARLACLSKDCRLLYRSRQSPAQARLLKTLSTGVPGRLSSPQLMHVLRGLTKVVRWPGTTAGSNYTRLKLYDSQMRKSPSSVVHCCPCSYAGPY
jgi:hypothetical protein